MIEDKLWETSFKTDYTYFNDVDEFIKWMDKNDRGLERFILKNEYNPGEFCENKFESRLLNSNTHLVYTDNSHNIAVYKNQNGISYINPSFYNQNRNKIIDFAKRRLKKDILNNKSSIYIPSCIFNSELIDEILYLARVSFVLFEFDDEIKLTKHQINILKKNHIQFTVRSRFSKENEISSNKLIGNYTKEDLETLDKIYFVYPFSDNEIDNLKYANENIIIELYMNSSSFENLNEEEYYEGLIRVFRILERHNRDYNVNITVINRELFRRADVLDNLPYNINLTIQNDFFSYDTDTYLKEEEKLEKYAKPIRESGLSNLEKFIAVYNIVKQFKKYKDYEGDPDKSRALRYILDENNEYIVCVGFSSLLRELLNRVGISSSEYGVDVDDSYKGGFTVEEKVTRLEGHQRILVKIDDDKYGVHGIYMSDSTWDNYIDKDIYVHSLMTFNRIKESDDLEALTKEEILLDFNTFEEFKNKINFFIKHYFHNNYYRIKEIESEYQDDGGTKDIYESNMFIKQWKINDEMCTIYIEAYRKIMEDTLDLLSNLDPDLFNKLYNKYNYKVYNNIQIKEMEEIFNSFIIEYYNLVSPLVNKEISLNTIIKAAFNVKKKINGYSKSELLKWESETWKENIERISYDFPYVYDYNEEREGYLNDSNKSL